MGSLDGKVAFISGGARGQGRSHAVGLARAGADIITFDICQQIDSVAYPMPGLEDLEQTATMVEAQGRRVVALPADVRDPEAVQTVLSAGLATLGRVDIVLANAGIMPIVGAQGNQPAAWRDAIDVMLSGVVYTIEAALPAMIEHGQGGSIVITSSAAGLKGPTRSLRVKSYGMLGYVAAKHGVVGLMRAYANALGPSNIRVNTVHPTAVNTPMIMNDAFLATRYETPELTEAITNVLPIPMVEAEDITNAILYLSSEAGRYVTGAVVPVDAGATIR